MFDLCLEWMCKGYIYAEVGGYSATTPEQKASVDRRKKEIGPLILEKLHVHAFSVRQGSGTSNSGVKSIMEFNYYSGSFIWANPKLSKTFSPIFPSFVYLLLSTTLNFVFFSFQFSDTFF